MNKQIDHQAVGNASEYIDLHQKKLDQTTWLIILCAEVAFLKSAVVVIVRNTVGAYTSVYYVV